MQIDSAVNTDPDSGSPESHTSLATGTAPSIARPQQNAKAASVQSGGTNGQFPQPKTDKPRPHVCGTCGRSFARLEHLKRHERSHTKEKPFECPECTRCFARRDLLLRHQQKLHMTNTATSKPRGGRRESVGGASVANSGRVRKSSIANGSPAGPGGFSGASGRPRANTIGHVDLASLGFLNGSKPGFNRTNPLGIDLSPNIHMGLAGPLGLNYRGVASSLGHHGELNALPKLDTQSVNNFGATHSHRTAPPFGSFAAQTGFDLDQLFSPGTTVNPAQLHFGGMAPPTSATFPQLDAFNGQQAAIPDGDDFGWMKNWNLRLPAGQSNEYAIEESSPSRMSSGDSPGAYSESVTNSTAGLGMPTSVPMPQPDFQTQPFLSTTPFQMDALGSGLPHLDMPPGTLSPSTLPDPTPIADAYFPQSMVAPNPQPQTPQDMTQSQSSNFFAPSLSNFSSDSPSHSSSSVTGSSARQSSVTSASTDSITEATRLALLSSLAQPSLFGHGHRKFSQPNASSPLSPGARRSSIHGGSFPSTADIRRYVDAFISFAHPHLPVMHIPTLSFDSPDFSNVIRGSAAPTVVQSGITGGGGALILGMAAIGALYEYDHPASKELFEAAKKMIGLYLEERRKADMSAAVNGMNGLADGSAHYTPLWLVQAMLLNIIYGHQCGDKTAADIASNHCAALVSLARAANLTRPASPLLSEARGDGSSDTADVHMNEAHEHIMPNGISHPIPPTDLHSHWLVWKIAEERKRTLFAIFIVSSLLTTAYNQTPSIMNSEILLDLPCDEEIWSAETAQEWQNRGGLIAAERSSMSFADALSTLLTANQRQGRQYVSTAYNSRNALGQSQAGNAFTDNEIRPSTFGCLVLINALHNYIWETRSRHHGRQWTPQETESMFSHIEPALNAWQAAWRANERHSLGRPNPFGLGPLSADSIPLLDLAFVRLFVNLGRAKEAFWQRDYESMANELARGAEIVQHAEGSPAATADAPVESSNGRRSASGDKAAKRRASQAQTSDQSSSRRERHLRKAAFYAADSLTIACSCRLTYADPAAHELPVQSAMCFFDCSLVLAEWACTVQERVGRYLGVLGRDNIDFAQVPAIMLLETEDVELLRKIEAICESFEAKRVQQDALLAMDLQQMSPALGLTGMKGNLNLSACGYGSKLARAMALMLEKAVVWPVTHVMGQALQKQAEKMDQRAEASLLQ